MEKAPTGDKGKPAEARGDKESGKIITCLSELLYCQAG